MDQKTNYKLRGSPRRQKKAGHQVPPPFDWRLLPWMLALGRRLQAYTKQSCPRYRSCVAQTWRKIPTKGLEVETNQMGYSDQLRQGIFAGIRFAALPKEPVVHDAVRRKFIHICFVSLIILQFSLFFFVHAGTSSTTE